MASLGEEMCYTFTTPVRFYERRGVSRLAPIMEALKQTDRYEKAELMATIINSMFTAYVKSSSDNFDTGLGVDEDGQPINDRDVYMGNGTVQFLNPGEDIAFADPKRPSKNFEAFEQAFMTKISSSLGLSVEMVQNRFTSSYTAARAALIQAHHQFKIDRQRFAFYFNQPIYQEFVTELVLRGLVDLQGFISNPLMKSAWLKAGWVGDSMGLIDPVKEMQAATMARKEQLKTSDELNREISGRPYLETLEQLDDENQERQDREMLMPDEFDRESKRIEANAKKETAENVGKEA